MRAKCVPLIPAGPPDSKSEERLAASFAAAGIPIYPQQIVESGYRLGFEYKADFAYYDSRCGLKLTVEVDGDFKLKDAKLRQKMADRDDCFVSWGWHILRFHALDCFHRPTEVVAWVAYHIQVLTVYHVETLDRELGPAWRNEAV